MWNRFMVFHLLILQLSSRGQQIPFNQLPFSNPLTSGIDSILHEQVKTFFQKTKAPGLIIGISQNGHRQYYSYGLADSTNQKQFYAKTIFEAGSITKTFTANLLLQLQGKGVLHIKDPAGRYLPITGNDSMLNKLIFSDIVSHQSGLPRLPSNIDKHKEYSLMQPYIYRREHLYPYLQSLKSVKPGKYDYSNLGFGLLGTIMENISGRSLESLFNEYILQPAGMDRSYIDNKKLNSDSATGYFSGKPAGYWLFDCMAAAGALKSTAEDMLKYLDAHHLENTNESFNSAVKAITIPQKRIAPQMQICYGWHTMETMKYPVYWHNGGTYGFSTFAAFEPVTHTSIILATNKFSANQSLDKLAGDLLIFLTSRE